MLDIIEKHYRHNRLVLVKRMRWRTGDERDAEDVVQEAYCRAIQYADSFKMGLPFNLWFQRILNNCLKDFKREHKGYLHVEIDEEELGGEECSGVNKKTQEEIEREIDQVSNLKHKEILSLYFVHDYPLRDINHLVDEKYRNIALIVGRFKTQMRKKYSEDLCGGSGS